MSAIEDSGDFEGLEAMEEVKGIEDIGQVIAILSDCSTAGGFVFVKLASKLSALAAVGSIVKDLIDIFKPDQHKEIMNKLAQIDRKLDEISQKMTDKFNELKAFMTEYHFYTDFAEIAFSLMRHVQDTLKYPNKDNYHILFAASQRTPPLDSAYKLAYRLSNRDTNPLVWAMNADKLMTKDTYDKWRRIIEGVMCQFLFLETYINGIFWHKNMIGPKEMKDAIDRIVKLMDKWKEEYRKNDYFWPDKVVRLVHDIQDRHMNVGNQWKADKLRSVLMSVLTDDVFYVLVYNDCAGYDNHAFYGRVDHLICSFRRGKCNVLIYRSRDARHASIHDLDSLKHSVEKCTVTIRGRSYKTLVEDFYKGNQFHNHALIGVVDFHRDLVIRSTNDCGREPGAVAVRQTRRGDKFYLIAGYK